ncbi:MAG: NlpC/P60 family protein [Planctomycetota bacterium]
MPENESSHAVVVWPAAHTFDDPADPGSVQTQVRYGAVVQCTEAREVNGRKWAKVRYGWGLTSRFDETGCTDEGWLDASALATTEADGAVQRYLSRSTAESGGTWLQVAALAAHGFAEPSRTAGPSVVSWPAESWLWATERTDVQAAPGAFGSRWWRVELPATSGGLTQVFVQKGDVVAGGLGGLDAAGSVAEARRMIGRPYVWGGASSLGYDCSGLVQMAARRRGVALPHSARQQFTQTDSFAGLSRVGDDLEVADVAGDVRTDGGRGTTCSPLGVEFAERAKARWESVLGVGDFVYFAMGAKRVDHVGIWAGGGEMVHASSSMMPAVRRELFWGSVFAARMLGVRRVMA